MVTTINLPDALHARIKSLAGSERRSMNAEIVVALETHVEQSERRAAVRAAARRVADDHTELIDRLGQ